MEQLGSVVAISNDCIAALEEPPEDCSWVELAMSVVLAALAVWLYFDWVPESV